MKVFGALLAALCAPLASGFVVPTTKSFSTELGVQYAPDGNVSTRYSTKTGKASLSDSWKRLKNRVDTMEKSDTTKGRPQRKRDPRHPVEVTGGSLKTWSFMSPKVERVQVAMETEGRPLECDIELWQGPDNTPTKMRLYIEDGCMRPFNAILATPRGPNTIAIRNTAQLEFPFYAQVVADQEDNSGPYDYTRSSVIQGGALRTYAFDPEVESVQILLETDGRPLNARIELLQGPNNNKQVMELYTEDGMDRPFLFVVATPGSGNVVRVVNTAPVEFPMTTWVDAYTYGEYDETEPVIGGDDVSDFPSDRRW